MRHSFLVLALLGCLFSLGPAAADEPRGAAAPDATSVPDQSLIVPTDQLKVETAPLPRQKRRSFVIRREPATKRQAVIETVPMPDARRVK